MAVCRGIGRSAIVLAVLVAARAQALEMAVQPRVTAGTQDYELSFADVITPNGNGFRFRDGFTIRDHLPIAGTGLTVSSGRLFADLSGQWSKVGHDQGEIFQGSTFDSAGDTTGALGFEHHFDARFSRQELNAALGWALTPNFSAYLGYKHASLNMTQVRAPIQTVQPNFGDVLQDGSYIMDFSYHGFFLGTTYSLPVRTWGMFSAQASIARLNASFRQHFEGSVFVVTPVGNLPLDPSFIDSRVSGDSNGLNAGLSWTGNVGAAGSALRGLTYTVGVDQSQYRFHGSATDGDFEEKNTRLRFELRYRFGGASD
jgi:hypothetical protein